MKAKEPTRIPGPDPKDLYVDDEPIGKKLTYAELNEFREIFNLVDTDASGDIDKQELQQLMVVLGLHPKPEEIDQMMKEVDSEGKGEISFEKFVEVMASKEVDVTYTPKQVKNAFRVFEEDDDAKGSVKTSVLEHALQTYGARAVSQDEAERLIDIIDPEKTGKVNYLDFVNMLDGI